MTRRSSVAAGPYDSDLVEKCISRAWDRFAEFQGNTPEEFLAWISRYCTSGGARGYDPGVTVYSESHTVKDNPPSLLPRLTLCGVSVFKPIQAKAWGKGC